MTRTKEEVLNILAQLIEERKNILRQKQNNQSYLEDATVKRDDAQKSIALYQKWIDENDRDLDKIEKQIQTVSPAIYINPLPPELEGRVFRSE